VHVAQEQRALGFSGFEDAVVGLVVLRVALLLSLRLHTYSIVIWLSVVFEAKGSLTFITFGQLLEADSHDDEPMILLPRRFLVFAELFSNEQSSVQLLIGDG